MIQGSRILYSSETYRRCVLCGKGYEFCQCRCSWCGARKWKKVGHYYEHHVCKGKAEE